VTLTFETGMRVASKVGNLPTEFGHARPSDSRIIRYVRDGRTYIDRRTDKSNAYCPFLYERGHNKEQLQARLISFPMHDRAGKWKIPSRQDYHFPYRKKSLISIWLFQTNLQQRSRTNQSHRFQIYGSGTNAQNLSTHILIWYSFQWPTF